MRTRKPCKQAEIAARLYHDWVGRYLPDIKGSSPHTIDAYKGAIKQFLTFLVGKGKTPGSLTLADFGPANVAEWMKSVKGRLSAATCNQRLAAVRSFLGYVGKEDPSQLYLRHGLDDVRMRKDTRKKVNGISKEAMGALMRMPDTKTWTGLRDFALMTLMYATAARVGEVLSLTVGQINLSAGKPCVTIVGKGSKVRTLYLLPKPARIMRRYLQAFHPDMDRDRPLFYTVVKGVVGNLTNQAVDKRLKKYAAMAHATCPEVPLDFHAHMIRHSKASHDLEDGMNILQISMYLGHSSLETTMRYLDITVGMEDQALSTLEDEEERNLPWKGSLEKDGDNALLKMFGL